MTLKKKIALLISCLFMNLASFCQSSEYSTAIDSLFAAVNKTPITSGIWYDRVFSAANLQAYNAAIDTVEGPWLEQAYFEIYNAAYNKSTLLGIDEFSYVAKLQRFKNIVPVAVLDFTLQHMQHDAVQQNLLAYNNGLFYNVAGQSPFVSKRIQMAAPLQENIKAGWVKFSLPDLLCGSNNGVTVNSVQLNFGTAGTLNLSLNQVDSIFLNTTGENLFTITTHYSNGQQFLTKCRIEVQPGGTTSRPDPETDPCYSEVIQSDIPFQGYDESQAYLGWNTVNYYYRTSPSIDCNVKVKRNLSKPVIIIDGFDPTNKRLAKWINDSAFLYFNPNTNSVENLGTQMRNQGYDLIVVNHPDYIEGTMILQTPWGPRVVERLVHGGGDYTERNAMVLVKIIQNIRDELQSIGSTEKIVVVGPSMGGQISRIALKYMENNIATTGPHKCRLWISMDSHQNGSVVPIGLQEMAKAMSKYFFKAKDAYDVQINSPIAKQALIHHNLANSETPAGAPGFFDRYHAYMSNLGYPQNLRKIAGNSGAHNGQLQNPGFTCAPAIELGSRWGNSGFLPGLLTFLFGDPKKTQKVSLAPDKVQYRCEVLDMDLKFGPFTLVKKKVYARHANNGLYDCSLEMLPGGHYPGFKEITDSLNSTNQQIFTSVYDYLIWFMKKKKWLYSTAKVNLPSHTHQVTGSTLGFGLGPNPNPNRKWDDDITGINMASKCEGETPFDAYFGPRDFNTRHDALYYEQALWFIDEINGIIRNNPQTHKYALISCNTNLICQGGTANFAVSPVIPGMVYTWTTSDPFLQIISGQGTPNIVVQHNGPASAQGSYQVNCSGSNDCFIVDIFAYNIWVGNQASPVWTYSNSQTSYGTLQQSTATSVIYNEACWYYWFNTSTRPWAGRTVVWEAIRSGGSNWYQSGDNLFLKFSAPGQSAKFVVHVSNACGTDDYYYNFRSVEGPGMSCPYEAKAVAQDEPADNLKVFPNPSSGLVTISLAEDAHNKSTGDIFEIRIIDKMANIRKVFRYKNGVRSVSISVEELGQDVYSVHAFDGKVWKVGRLTKQ